MRETGSLTDADLLAEAKRERVYGHSYAFEEILHRYERLVFHVARRYFSGIEDAMDASQEAVIKIYNGILRVTLPEDGSLKAWICTVTARSCLDGLRKRRPATVEISEGIYTQTSPSAEENAAANERVRDIIGAISNLPEAHRIVIILRDIQDLSYEEIATALEISVGTVKSRLSRARTSLKKALD